MSTVLFLDFDGVLHPVGGAAAGTRLSQLPLLADLLREPAMADVQVVIASTWREMYPVTRLRKLFPADLQTRIVDATPVLDDYVTDHERYEEIRAWLDEHPETVRWAALDDDRDGFPPKAHRNAVFPDATIGATPTDIDSLRNLLAGG